MQSTDIKFYYPTVRAADGTNGGRMSGSQIVSGVSSNIFDVIRSAERAAEYVEWEKVFCANRNSSNEIGYSPKVWLDGDALNGDDWAYFIVSTQRGVQSDITGSEQKYVAGLLKSAIITSDQTLVVTVKTATQAAAWINGGTIRLMSGRLGTAPTIVDAIVSSAPSVSGLDVTLQFGSAIGTAFAAGAIVAMLYEHADECTPTLDTTSHTGGADLDTDYITLDNQGTVEQTWTLTILSGAASYTLVGDVLGNVGTGSTTASFAPTNPDVSLPYLTIAAAAFTGLTLSAGDTFTCQTHPAAVPVFLKKTNPEDAELVNSNSLGLCFEIEG